MQRLSITLAYLILFFGVITFDLEAPKWGAFSLFLYSLPAFSLFIKRKKIRIYILWFGIFLVSQTALSYFKYLKYHHLTPNMKYQIDVQGEGLPGIQGLQSISTDEMGFRTTKKIDYKNKLNGIRIFALGASTTELIYLDDHKTWSHHLQENLSEETKTPVEVINTGVSGLRMVHIHDNFKKILKFHPDVALFLVGVNDWNKDILNHFEPSVEKLNRLYAYLGGEYYEFTRCYLRNTLFGLAIQKIPFRKKVEETPLPSLRTENGDYFTKQNNTLSKKDVRHYIPENILWEYRTYLEKTAMLCKKHNVHCVFLTQPNAYKASVDEKTKRFFWMTPPNANYTLDLESMIGVAEIYNLKLKEIAKHFSISVCDLDKEIPASLESFYDEVHFNEKGSALVGKILTRCLKYQGNMSR